VLQYFLSYREIVCCGSIFKGSYGEIIIHPAFFKPCTSCLSRRQLPISSASASPIHSSASTSPTHSVESTSSSSERTSLKQSTKTFSDLSSDDSGYDDFSINQDESKLAKKVQVKDVEMIEDAMRPIELDKSLQISNVTNQSHQSISN